MAKKTTKNSLGRVGRVEREQRYNRILQIVTISVIAVVVLVTLVGFVLNTWVYPNQPILTVDGEEIPTSMFEKRVKLERDRLLNEYSLYYSLYSNSTDATLQQQYQYFMSQVQYQMQTEVVGQSVANQLIDEEFIMREANSRGIEVTDQEVTDYMHFLFGYFPDGEPEPTPTMEMLPTSTLSATQLAMITPTPEVSPTPTVAEETNSEEDTAAEATPTTAAPEETPMTQEDYQTALQAYLDRVGEYGVDETFLRDLIRRQLYRDKLNEEIAKGVLPQQEEVWARHILVETEEEAQDILDQLNEGADWGELAAEYSTDTSNAPNGGDLGWFAHGEMVTPFEDAAFAGEVGEIIGPVQTDFGYHLIQIVGHEMRPVSGTDFDNLVTTALTEVLNTYKEDGDVVFADNWEARIPTKPSIPLATGQ